MEVLIICPDELMEDCRMIVDEDELCCNGLLFGIA